MKKKKIKMNNKEYICGGKNENAMITEKYIRFDWAAKRMLRDKSNFGVFEGLISVLLNEEIHIVEFLESESNQENAKDKFNRVDIKAKNSKGEIIIVEVQQDHEMEFVKRALYGVSKAITEHMTLGKSYQDVKKIYHIGILYFNLGQGDDYLYHGKTEFVGVHTKDKLRVRTKDMDAIRTVAPEELLPEYYLIRVNEFVKEEATTPLEEWIDYLKCGHIKDDTQVPGLSEAKEKLLYIMMNRDEQISYDNHLMEMFHQNNVMDTYRIEGYEKGIKQGLAKGMKQGMKEGRKEGRKEGKVEGKLEGLAEGVLKGRAFVAKNMLAKGIELPMISNMIGIPENEIEKLVSTYESD